MATLLDGDAGHSLLISLVNEYLDEAAQVLQDGDDDEYAQFLLDSSNRMLDYRTVSLLFARAQIHCGKHLVSI